MLILHNITKHKVLQDIFIIHKHMVTEKQKLLVSLISRINMLRKYFGRLYVFRILKNYFNCLWYFRCHFRNSFEKIRNKSIICNLENGCFRVFIYGYNCFTIFHTSQMLNCTRNTNSNIKILKGNKNKSPNEFMKWTIKWKYYKTKNIALNK